MTTHWLRHTNATHRLLAGASLETTQDELGHADPHTTRIYAKTSDTKRREDAEKLAAWFGAIDGQ
jgi:site-specific recombinase XerD